MLSSSNLKSLFTGTIFRVFSLFSSIPATRPSCEMSPKNTKADHTETLQLEYDPAVTTYDNLLDIFWENHDITAKNKPQYMSAIFYHDDEQYDVAMATMEEKQKKTARKIQTKILSAQTFFDAEGYHQKYLLRRHRPIFSSLNLRENEVISSSVAARLNGYLNGHGTVERLMQELSSWNLNEKQNSAIVEGVENYQCVGGSCGR